MEALRLRLCSSVVAIVIVMVMVVATLSAGPPDSSAQECSIDNDESFLDLLRGEQTPLILPPKSPKVYTPSWRASRRRGLQPIVTTLYSIHSRESVPILKGRLPPDEVLDELFRCRGFGERRRMDPRLVEILLAAADHFKAPRVEIISAYRSPKFNDALAKKGRRVAAESRHTRGEAIDFSLPKVRAAKVGRWLWETFEGGVGTYSRNNFVHVDVGPKRRWKGK